MIGCGGCVTAGGDTAGMGAVVVATIGAEAGIASESAARLFSVVSTNTPLPEFEIGFVF